MSKRGTTSGTEMEALAVVRVVDHFTHYLYGTKFKVLTDHRPLPALLTSKTLNRRIRGMALKLMQYYMCIDYREGVSNGNTDGLSRQTWAITAEDKRNVPDGEMSECNETGKQEEEAGRQDEETATVPRDDFDAASMQLGAGGCGDAHRGREEEDLH